MFSSGAWRPYVAYILLGSFVVLMFGVGVSSGQGPIVAQPTVVLTEQGYQPSNIRIRKGDTVTFRTDRSVPFWPSANPHPTHGLYPEFDAGTPISPTAQWTFVFDRIGEWSYHDFLRPYYRGIIYVTE